MSDCGTSGATEIPSDPVAQISQHESPVNEREFQAIAWTVWPAGKSPVKALLAIGVILAAAFLAGELMEHLAWSVFSAGLMLLFQHRFFLPNTFVVNEQGVSVGHFGTLRQVPWHRMRRFHFGDDGGLVSTRVAGRSPRGDTVVMFDGNGDAVSAAIQDGMRRWSAPSTEMKHVP